MSRVRDDADVDEQDGPDAGVGVAVEEVATRSPVEPAVCQGRDPGWQELLELADRVGPSEQLAALDDRALERQLRARAARMAAEMCRWLDLVAELVIRRVWADQGATTPAVWLSWAVGMSPTTARDRVRVALRLRELSRVRDELAAGRISYSKVRAITRVAVPETEELLLTWAREATGADMERIVAGFRTAQRAVTAGTEELRQARQVHLRRRGDGTSEVVIRMPDDEATALYAAAQRLVDLEENATAQAAGDGQGEDDDGTGTASAESATCGQAASGIGGDSQVVAAVQAGQRPRGARMADALLATVQTAVAAGGSDATGADRDTLVIHVNGDDLATIEDGMDVPVAVDTPHGTLPAMSRRVLRRMACDGGLVLVPTDRSGAPIDIGRRERRLTTALRRALLERDRSCRFPGCGARRHLHGHHIWHWADGGPTDLDNLVVLCSFHHRYVHDHDIDVRLRPGAAHEFRRRDGRRIARVQPLVAGDDGDADARIRSGPGPAPGFDALAPTDWDGRYNLETTVAVLQRQVHAVLPHAAGSLAA